MLLCYCMLPMPETKYHRTHTQNTINLFRFGRPLFLPCSTRLSRKESVAYTRKRLLQQQQNTDVKVSGWYFKLLENEITVMWMNVIRVLNGWNVLSLSLSLSLSSRSLYLILEKPWYTTNMVSVTVPWKILYNRQFRRLIRLRVRILCGTGVYTAKHICGQKNRSTKTCDWIQVRFLTISSTPSYGWHVYELHDSTNEFANDVNPFDPFDCFEANCVSWILSQQPPSIIDPHKRYSFHFRTHIVHCHHFITRSWLFSGWRLQSFIKNFSSTIQTSFIFVSCSFIIRMTNLNI